MPHRNLTAFLLVFEFLSMSPASAQSYGQNGSFWHGHDGWGHMMFGGVGMVLFWGIIIVLAVLLVRALAGRSASPPPTALEILQQRYAKGEISKEEYEERRKTLSS